MIESSLSISLVRPYASLAHDIIFVFLADVIVIHSPAGQSTGSDSNCVASYSTQTPRSAFDDSHRAPRLAEAYRKFLLLTIFVVFAWGFGNSWRSPTSTRSIQCVRRQRRLIDFFFISLSLSFCLSPFLSWPTNKKEKRKKNER